MTSEEIPAVPKKKWSRRKKATVLFLTTVFAIVTLITFALLAQESLIPDPYLSVTKGSTATDTTWSITSIGFSILKSDIYVQVWNSTGTYTVQAWGLDYADGRQGFNYTPTSSGDYLSVGDVFGLNKTIYPHGSKVILIIGAAGGAICTMTV